MKNQISKKKLEEIYEKMNLTRFFEEKISYFFSIGQIHGTTHLYIGEEAIGVGACCALEKEDLITSTHRGHGHCIGKGIDINKMMAEMLGRETGCSKGKSGSMHIADLNYGNLGENGVVAGGIPIATGAALALKMQNKDNIVVCFFGDGATNQGAFHESLNLASVWKLPIIYLCENNKYGMSMHISKSMNIQDISARSQSYGIPGKTIDGNDSLSVYDEVKKQKEYVKKNGPVLLVANTHRWYGHSKSDTDIYRTDEDRDNWKKDCPIKHLRTYLIDNQIFTQPEIEHIEKKAKNDIETAVSLAIKSNYPKYASIFDDIYA